MPRFLGSVYTKDIWMNAIIHFQQFLRKDSIMVKCSRLAKMFCFEDLIFPDSAEISIGFHIHMTVPCLDILIN